MTGERHLEPLVVSGVKAHTPHGIGNATSMERANATVFDITSKEQATGLPVSTSVPLSVHVDQMTML